MEGHKVLKNHIQTRNSVELTRRRCLANDVISVAIHLTYFICIGWKVCQNLHKLVN